MSEKGLMSNKDSNVTQERSYRKLTDREVATLKQQGCSAQDDRWQEVLVTDQFTPDRVEFAVRAPDLAVVRMTTFREGKPLTTVRITKIELDGPMDESKFVLELPPRVTPIDVMDHPPAREQIQAVLADAGAKGWKADSQEKGKGGEKGDGDKEGKGEIENDKKAP